MKQREIKYKYWDTELKRWFTKNDLIEHKSIGWFFDPFSFSFMQTMNILEGEIRKVTNIIPVQYTGFNDRNGKEIYEDAIVEFYSPLAPGSPPIVFQFTYLEKKKHFGFKEIESASLDFPGLSQASKFEKYIRVIGNVYENQRYK